MRKVAAAIALALLAGSSPDLSAGASFSYESAMLQSVSVTIEANGRVRYQFAALANGSAYTGEGVWDPLTRRAQEALKELNGNVIQSRATCDADPWLVALAPCADGIVSSKGLNTAMRNIVNNMKAPIGARLMNVSDRARVKAEFDRAAAAKAAADKAAADRKAAEERRQAAIKAALAKQSATEKVVDAHPGLLPSPTAPAVAQLHSSKGGLMAVAPTKTPVPPTKTPTPPAKAPAPPPAAPAAPAFGAVYTPGALAQVRVNQPANVSVTVKNTSSQTWPASGAFHLSYHWLRGGATVEFDGQRTFLTTAVPPGGQVTLNANVRGPASPGAYTIAWDMVQEGVAWFSNRGVPTADRPVNVIP